MPSGNEASLLPYVGVLLAIERSRSLSAAAAELGSTQSAVTKSLRRAEEELGQRLFRRHARGVSPTPAGLVALDHARLIQRHSQAAVNAIKAASGLAGIVRIGAGASFLDALLPRAIASVATRRSDARFELRATSGSELLTGLSEDALDLAFTSEPPDLAALGGIVWTPLVKDDIDIVARRDHPLVANRDVLVEELAGYGWVLGGASDPQQERLARLFRDNGAVLPNPTVETVSRNATIEIVRHSDLLSIMPSPLIDAAKGIAAVSSRQVRLRRRAGLAMRADAVLPLAGRDLIDEIKALCKASDDLQDAS